MGMLIGEWRLALHPSGGVDLVCGVGCKFLWSVVF
jgi:hypothetical protein